jgi:hypothetical protein
MYCKHLSKCLNGKLRCKIKKTSIYITECQKCLKKEFRKPQGIKKVSSKRITVTKETYNKVFERDEGKCRLADITCNGALELHHILYRSEAKDLINEPTNCIMLCNGHHRLVHSNKHLWQPILKEIINND